LRVAPEKVAADNERNEQKDAVVDQKELKPEDNLGIDRQCLPESLKIEPILG
jgi:hypothetical protein